MAFSQSSNARYTGYYLAWLEIREPHNATMKGPFLNTGNINDTVPLQEILDHHRFSQLFQQKIIRAIYMDTCEIMESEIIDGITKTVTIRLEYNGVVANAVRSATVQQPLEIWTVIQPTMGADGAKKVNGFTDTNTINAIARPGEKYFNIGALENRTISFSREEDAIAYARSLLKEWEDGSRSEGGEYDSVSGQVTHGIVIDEDGVGVLLVSIVKSIVP